MPKWVAAAGTAMFFVVVYGGTVVYGPQAFTGWQAGPPYPVAVLALGVVLIAADTRPAALTRRSRTPSTRTSRPSRRGAATMRTGRPAC
jgi:hypothetical protein